MPLTTAQNIADELGVTLDSTNTDQLERIANAVSTSIENFCDRKFDYDDYVEIKLGKTLAYKTYTQDGWDGNDIDYPIVQKNKLTVRLLNRPIDYIKYAAYGESKVITATYSGTTPAQIYVKEDKLVVSTALSSNTTSISTSTTIKDVSDAIELLPNWTSTCEADYEDYPAKALVHAYQGPDDATDGDVDYVITAAVNPMTLNEMAEGLYVSNITIGQYTPWIIIYKGGYSTIPDILVEIATKAGTDWYRSLQYNTGFESERIGDYSYKKFSGSGSTSGSITGIFSNFKTELLAYRNVSI